MKLQKLSTQEKAAIAPLLHKLSNHSSVAFRLSYIPKGTHSIEHIAEAALALNDTSTLSIDIITTPLFSALLKSNLVIIDSHQMPTLSETAIVIKFNDAFNIVYNNRG